MMDIGEASHHVMDVVVMCSFESEDTDLEVNNWSTTDLKVVN